MSSTHVLATATLVAAFAFAAAAQTAAPGPARGWTGKFQKPSEAELKKRLTAIQYDVTQKSDTERAFSNEYWNNERPGIYVDVVSGEPLFSSRDKFESGTGWPSFTRPLERENVKIATGVRASLFGAEVRSAHADSHLGHVFKDGPPPTGDRFCMNSAALRFIPADKLEEEGYPQYKALFVKK